MNMELKPCVSITAQVIYLYWGKQINIINREDLISSNNKDMILKWYRHELDIFITEILCMIVYL